jgi:two-component system, OmpR family, sensor histidine kinase VicK
MHVDFLRLPNPSISVHTVAPEILVPIKKSINAITVMVKKKDVEDDGEQYNNYQQVIVSIKDTGTVIDPQIFPRLFTKFATKSETGTGLGLFICKGIVEAHGGKIWAENNADGKGATFEFTLPIVNK